MSYRKCGKACWSHMGFLQVRRPACILDIAEVRFVHYLFERFEMWGTWFAILNRLLGICWKYISRILGTLAISQRRRWKTEAKVLLARLVSCGLFPKPSWVGVGLLNFCGAWSQMQASCQKTRTMACRPERRQMLTRMWVFLHVWECPWC